MREFQNIVKVRYAGNSTVVPLTKQLAALGMHKGDKAYVYKEGNKIIVERIDK